MYPIFCDGDAGRARCLPLGRLAVESTGLHEVLHRLLEGPATSLEVYVHPMRAARYRLSRSTCPWDGD